jgi:hypothetical protein
VIVDPEQPGLLTRTFDVATAQGSHAIATRAVAVADELGVERPARRSRGAPVDTSPWLA